MNNNINQNVLYLFLQKTIISKESFITFLSCREPNYYLIIMYIVMKSNAIPYLLISAIFVIVIIFSCMMCSKTNNHTPYYKNNIFKNGFHPYEGFVSNRPLQYSSKSDNTAVDYHSSHSINNGSKKSCTDVFGGLFCSSDVADNNIDIFSEAQGSLNCAGSGLTNSRGNLCLDKNMSQMLQTRGGNSTGHDSYIGN